MTYLAVSAAALISLGVVAVETGGARRGGGSRDSVRVAGLGGTRGFPLAGWGMAFVILAAPIDDLWHRLFGVDVALWSPPHLLGLLGGIVNAAACWWIAGETYPEGSRTRLVAVVLAGALVYGGVGVGLQPAVRIAYAHGGPAHFTYPVLAALPGPLAPVATALASGLTMLVTAALVLARLPAFAQALPSALDTLLAAVLTVLAAGAGGALASRTTPGWWR